MASLAAGAVNGDPTGELAGGTSIAALPLFPLRRVLFPDGVLMLKVFEARYLDLVSQCLRSAQAFGVVCLLQGGEVRAQLRIGVHSEEAPAVCFETVGVLARLTEVDSDQPGVLNVRCLGTQRFRLDAAAAQRGDGLWLGAAKLLDADAHVAPPPSLQPSVHALAQALAALQTRGAVPLAQPYRYDDAGWVANRWCEILPLPLADKQALMVLPDPLRRLQQVQVVLRAKGVLSV